MDTKTTMTTALPPRSESSFMAPTGAVAFWQLAVSHRTTGLQGFGARVRAAYDVPRAAITTVTDPMTGPDDRTNAKQAAPPRRVPR